MSNFILDRDSFVNEIYSKKNQDELNEGIFDFLKTLTRNEWKNVKSKNADILKELEKVDHELTGFTLMKLKKSGKCTQIRQTLCDFANTLWEAKEKELKDGEKLQRMLMGLKDKGEISEKEEEQVKKAGTVSKYLKQFDIKDKSLADNLKNYEKKVSELVDGDPDLTRWSNLLKNDIRNIVNNLIIKEYDKVADDEDKKKAAKEIKNAQDKIKKQQEEQKKKDEQKNKEAEKKQKDRIEKLEKERETSISNLGVTPIKGKTGDKTYTELTTEFNNTIEELGIDLKSVLESNIHQYSFDNLINESDEPSGKDDKDASEKFDILDKDTFLGINKIPELIKNAKVKDDELAKKILLELGIVFNAVKGLSKEGKLFKDMPSDAVQALYVGLTSVVTHAMTDGELNDDTKNLLARCAISDKTLGYGLPIVSKKDGNIFVAITTTLEKLNNDKAFMSKGEGDKEEVNSDLVNMFKKNIKNMFQQVTNYAEDLKKQREKEDEQEAKKEEQEENNN